ncbi:hypothetical protein ACP70R_020413 [Stipagrostis hirtigluma subsp. patula]
MEHPPPGSVASLLAVTPCASSAGVARLREAAGHAWTTPGGSCQGKRREEHRTRTWAASLMQDLHMREEEEWETYGVPAAKKAIVALHIPSWGEIREEHGCAICLEGLEIDQKLRMMPCHHTFHQSCIFDWLLINRLCPVCQFALRSNEEQRLLDEQAARARDEEEQVRSYQRMIMDVD